MGLRIRMGEGADARVMEFHPRPLALALVVGRRADADLSLPAAPIAERHCLLFVHNGRWAVKDAGGRGTYVNGQGILKARYLKAGDLITLGMGRAAVELAVESADAEAASQAAAGMAVAVAREAPAAGQGGVDAWMGQSQPQASDWPQGGRGYAPAPLYVPRHRRGPSLTGLAIGLALVICLAGGYAIYQLRERTVVPPPREIVVQKPPPAESPRTPAKPSPRTPVRDAKANNIFDETLQELDARDAANGKAGPRTTQGPAPQAPTPRVMPNPVGPAINPLPQSRPTAAGDADWQRVEQAYLTSPLPMKICAFEEYRARHPASPNLGDLAAWEEEAVEQLWWTRVKELAEKRDEAQKQVEQLDQQLSDATDEQFKRQAAADRTQQEQQRQRLVNTLALMGYTSNEVPNLYDAAQLTRLRAQRVSRGYDAWRKSTVRYIQQTKGGLPWERR